MTRTLTPGKKKDLDAVADARGVIAALAVDQRSPMRALFGKSMLLLAYERTGYDKAVKSGLPVLLERWSALRLMDAGLTCYPGFRNIENVNLHLRSAVPWHRRCEGHADGKDLLKSRHA
jgi:hypothetical protein